VQHADVKLLTNLERVDSKTLGVEELLALAAVLADGLVALGNPAAQFDDDGQLERESDEWVGWVAQRVLKKMKNEREGCSPSSLVHRAAA
jgi:hypothetical protein